LAVHDVKTPGDTRPIVSDTEGPRWGLHGSDVNLALGNLVAIVRSEVASLHST
jgi:hypothetical protein